MAVVRLLTSQLLFILFFILLLLSPLSISRRDKEALLDFKDSLENTEALDSTWTNNTSPCLVGNKHWVGVICHGDKVYGLNLMGFGLSGDIDIDYLSELDYLRGFQIANNNFSGPIPAFNKIGALKSLFIHGNQFSGEISPDFFLSMGSLKKVWLSGNKFSGKIPESLGKLNYLIEAYLDHNEFSGPIPELSQSSLKVINLSNNKFEGEIPKSMSKFGVWSFEGNPELCGAMVQRDCNKINQSQIDSDTDKMPFKSEHESNGNAIKYVVMGVVVAILVAIILFKAKRKEHYYSGFEKENLDEVVQVRIPNTNWRSHNPFKGGDSVCSSSKRGSQHEKSMTDLVLVNDEKGQFGLLDLMKAAAEVLGNGSLGSTYKAVMSNGLSVVVKRLREMNKLNMDGFDAEIKRLGKLRHPNILPPLAYYYGKDEKLLVNEFVPKGSLMYLLHGDRGISHGQLNWPTRLKIIQGVARGIGYLHSEFSSSELPHGNLKSSNILLSPDYEPLLTDYGFYPFIRNTQTTKTLFAYKSPEAILHQQVTPKTDVYCFGVVILEILTGTFPSHFLNNQKGGIDILQRVRSMIAEKRVSELIDPDIADATYSLPEMQKLLNIAASCTQNEQKTRMSMKEAIRKIEEIQV